MKLPETRVLAGEMWLFAATLTNQLDRLDGRRLCFQSIITQLNRINLPMGMNKYY